MLTNRSKSQLAEDFSLTELESPSPVAAPLDKTQSVSELQDHTHDHDLDGFQSLELSLERPSEEELGVSHQPKQAVHSKPFDPLGLGRYQRGTTILDKVVNYLADLLRRLDLSFFRGIGMKEERKKVVVIQPKEELDSFQHPKLAKKKKKRGWFAFIR